MMNSLLKKLTDLIYGTKRAKRIYELKNSGEKVIVADACKGIITTDKTNITLGLDWVKSQRAVIMLTQKNIICGKWSIPINSISDAKLTKLKTLFGGAQVLTIQTVDETNYQFGMQVNPEWTNQKQLLLIVEDGNLQYSKFSIIVRLILILYLGYWVYSRFF